MNPFEKFELHKDTFTKSEIEIMNYILKNPFDIIQLPILDIADSSNTSKSAIIRFCQKLGYKGFSEFKFDMTRYLVSNNQEVQNIDEQNSITAITSSYIDYINKINMSLTIDEVITIAKLILKANKIKIFGYNRTGFSAQQLRYRLSKIGFDSEAINDQVLMQDVSSMLTKGDLCIIFSIKAMSKPYGDCVKILKENNCKIVLVTMNPRPAFKKDCTEVITLPNISKMSSSKFLDDQAIFFVFIEIILSELAKLSNK